NLVSRTRTRTRTRTIGFMVPMHAEKRKGASHEPGGARLRRALISLLWRSGSEFDVGCSSCQLAVVGGVMCVVKNEHEETLQVAFPADPRSGPAGGSVGVVSGSDREGAGGKANPGADRPEGEDRQGVHRPPEPNARA